MTSKTPMNSGTDVADPHTPKSSRFSTLATATTFEAIGITPRPSCERSNPSECDVGLPPITTDGEWEIPKASNPYRLVRQDGAFENAIGNNGSVLFPADLDLQFIAYYVPKYSLSDDWDTRSLSDDVWFETALLPVIWNQTGCSGIMGVSMYRGMTEHPRDSFFFVDESGGTSIETSFSYGQTSVELTVSGYQLNTEDGVTAALTLTRDDEGRCVATVKKDE